MTNNKEAREIYYKMINEIAMSSYNQSVARNMTRWGEVENIMERYGYEAKQIKLFYESLFRLGEAYTLHTIKIIQHIIQKVAIQTEKSLIKHIENNIAMNTRGYPL